MLELYLYLFYGYNYIGRDLMIIAISCVHQTICRTHLEYIYIIRRKVSISTHLYQLEYLYQNVYTHQNVCIRVSTSVKVFPLV